jgi:hypothetical protein
MTHFGNGLMVRETQHPAVWYIDNGQKRWVPDGQTVESLGGWAAVQLV